MKCKTSIRTTMILLCVMTAICVVSWNSWMARADEEWKFFYWGFENTLSDANSALTAEKSDGTFAAGKVGKAVDIAANGAIKTNPLTIDTTKGYTLAGWIYLNDGAAGYNIVMSSGNTLVDTADRFQLHISGADAAAGGGYIKAYSPAVESVAFPDEETENNFVPFETWTHVAITYNGQKAVIYLNGKAITERTVNGKIEKAMSQYNCLTIGALNHDATTFQFNGLIDEAAYANCPLTAEQVSVLASKPADAAVKMNNWAKGTEKITPDTIVTPAPTEQPTDPQTPSGGKTVYYWPLDENEMELSHHELNFDHNDIGLYYADAVVNQGAEIIDNGTCSAPFTEETNFSNFSISFWTKWETPDSGFAVLFGMGAKELPHHFELYLVITDAETAYLAFYNTASGTPVEGIAKIENDQFTHIACTYNGQTISIYVNGENVLEYKMTIDTHGFGNNDDSISLGCLADGSLVYHGIFDEVILADYAFDNALLSKLYSSPKDARTDVENLVKANYPEGYHRDIATAKPSTAPTVSPAAKTAAPPTNAKTPPVSSPNQEGMKTSTKITIIIIATVVVAGGAVAVYFILKKRQSKLQ